LKSILGREIKPLDVIIYGSPDEILSRKSIEFLKWHKNEWLHVLTFRLKWNVYGFFFQHPDRTNLRAKAIHYQLLDYIGDFDKITSSSENTFIVGDLNHYGGWYCEFCHQVSDIVSMINHDDIIKSHNHLSPVINKEFVENLIRDGKYVNLKVNLIKQHNYDEDKYFLPKTVRNNRWKFENLISNYYGRLIDDIDDEYY
jgi:beta-1,4-mannosyl-glycoprotein beta-1,4-N-acetylglucosaminyltransferase